MTQFFKIDISPNPAETGKPIKISVQVEDVFSSLSDVQGEQILDTNGKQIYITMDETLKVLKDVSGNPIWDVSGNLIELEL